MWLKGGGLLEVDASRGCDCRWRQILSEIIATRASGCLPFFSLTLC